MARLTSVDLQLATPRPLHACTMITPTVPKGRECRSETRERPVPFIARQNAALIGNFVAGQTRPPMPRVMPIVFALSHSFWLFYSRTCFFFFQSCRSEYPQGSIFPLFWLRVG